MISQCLSFIHSMIKSIIASNHFFLSLLIRPLKNYSFHCAYMTGSLIILIYQPHFIHPSPQLHLSSQNLINNNKWNEQHKRQHTQYNHHVVSHVDESMLLTLRGIIIVNIINYIYHNHSSLLTNNNDKQQLLPLVYTSLWRPILEYVGPFG